MKRIPSAPRTTLSLASLALLASLTACGGGGGGDDGEGDSGAGAAETTAPATVILEGQVTKGPVAGATVVALRVAADGTPGAELARTTSAADGSYRLSVPAEATTVLVQASGGTYDHEYIDGVDSTPLDAPLRSWVTLGAGATGSRSVHLTPLTETAVRRALAASGGATEANLAAAAAAVVRETALAGTDLVSTAAVVTGTTNAYGQAVLRLARLMQQAGSLEAILALYAQGVPGDTAVVATVALPPEMARSALHDTRWRSRCIVSRGITTTSEGTQITYTGIPPGAWFGEGTLLKREVYRYNVEALRKSTVAGLPVETFWRLLDRSIPFNRFVMRQLNERLSQFIAAREIDRTNQPDARVARSLAALFNPVLYPGVGELLRITQQELAWLVGLSRQRVNQALNALQAAGLIRVEYGGVRVIDLAALRGYQAG